MAVTSVLQFNALGRVYSARFLSGNEEWSVYDGIKFLGVVRMKDYDSFETSLIEVNPDVDILRHTPSKSLVVLPERMTTSRLRAALTLAQVSWDEWLIGDGAGLSVMSAVMIEHERLASKDNTQAQKTGRATEVRAPGEKRKTGISNQNSAIRRFIEKFQRAGEQAMIVFAAWVCCSSADLHFKRRVADMGVRTMSAVVVDDIIIDARFIDQCIAGSVTAREAAAPWICDLVPEDIPKALARMGMDYRNTPDKDLKMLDSVLPTLEEQRSRLQLQTGPIRAGGAKLYLGASDPKDPTEPQQDNEADEYI